MTGIHQHSSISPQYQFTSFKGTLNCIPVYVSTVRSTPARVSVRSLRFGERIAQGSARRGAGGINVRVWGKFLAYHRTHGRLRSARRRGWKRSYSGHWPRVERRVEPSWVPEQSRVRGMPFWKRRACSGATDAPNSACLSKGAIVSPVYTISTRAMISCLSRVSRSRARRPSILLPEMVFQDVPGYRPVQGSIFASPRLSKTKFPDSRAMSRTWLFDWMAHSIPLRTLYKHISRLLKGVPRFSSALSMFALSQSVQPRK